eukprot:300478-Lingulodinium_polyedra.AAC.1
MAPVDHRPQMARVRCVILLAHDDLHRVVPPGADPEDMHRGGPQFLERQPGQRAEVLIVVPLDGVAHEDAQVVLRG